MSYQRRNAGRAILLALQDIGGVASRKQIKKRIADNEETGFTYDDVFEKVAAKSGKEYEPFDFDFNFSLKELGLLGYIEPPQRGQDIALTEKGRASDASLYLSADEAARIADYWQKKSDLRRAKNASQASAKVEPITSDLDSADDNSDTWQAQLISQLKQFSPAKFESFSRLLISKMGVKIDKKMGIVKSADHGIDGFGYFESGEFRTSRVAIQAKRFTDSPVSEPDIDKFKGVMDGFNAEYGIFITTSYFTDQAKAKAVRGNRSVTLVDGQRIAELVEQYRLHITPVQTFTLDDYYFEES